MIKLEYFIAAGVALLWLKGRKTQQAQNQTAETVASQKGSDWIGSGGMYAMWDRLNGSDLIAKNSPNASGSVSADFGIMERGQAKISPAWDGTLHA